MRYKRPASTIIRRSCLTGQVVWVYRGPSEEAGRKAYMRACRREVQRVRRWANTVARRMAAVTGLLSRCRASLPDAEALTPRQAEAARTLQAVAKADVPCHRDFYDHIIEERRRRRRDSEIRRKMREREKRQNADYVK